MRISPLLLLASLLTGCASIPPKPDLTMAPPAVRKLKMRLVSVDSNTGIGELSEALKRGFEVAFAEAGVAQTAEMGKADLNLFVDVAGAHTSTLDPYVTSLTARSPDGLPIERLTYTGGYIGNNFNRLPSNWTKIANGIAYNLVYRLINSPSVSSFAEKGGAKAAPAAGMTKEEMLQLMKTAVGAKDAAPAPAAAEPKSDVDAPSYKVSANPDAYAVVVGVEKYNALPDAKWAERDAKAVQAHLLAMGYPQRNVVLLTGPQATRTSLAKNLEAWLPNQVTERSTVLFYFSGHGAPDSKTSQAYLVPMDGDPQYLEETAYPVKRVYEKLGALKAKRVLVALDSCFSGAGGRSVLAAGTRPLVAKLDIAPSGRVTSLTASSGEEITGALDEQGHGLFTYWLLKALTETAGRGTVAELRDSLTPRVQDEARRQNRAQTPQAYGALDSTLR